MIKEQFVWLQKLIRRFDESHIALVSIVDLQSGVKVIEVLPKDWRQIAQCLAVKKFRFSALWGQQNATNLSVNMCLELKGEFLIFKTLLAEEKPTIESISTVYQGASRLERHCRDMLGIQFSNTQDNRRWTRHQAWAENEYPLQDNFPSSGHAYNETVQGDSSYPFYSIKSDSVYEIPVGPVHAGIIEPGHFRFLAMGEKVLNLEERLGYVHKGIEKVAVGRDPDGLVRLAGRVSGDSTVAYSWSACQALENATNTIVPERAIFIRGLLCERERIINHLGDIGAICNDVGYSFAIMQFSRLRELWQRRNRDLFNHRFMMDVVVPGGVNVDLNKNDIQLLLEDIKSLRKEVHEIFAIQRKSQSLRDRVHDTGFLSKKAAAKLGCLGYVGRASGLTYDLRFDNPYPPYDKLSFDKALSNQGDVQARIIMRAKEIYASLNALTQLLEALPEGDIRVDLLTHHIEAEGVGIVEGWRGEIFSYIKLTGDGTVSRYFPRDPSWFNWPALENLIHDNIVPDFPVCNKSVNGSYSGHDL